MYEAQREHTRGARFNVETQILAIENANVNLETLNAMKVGSAAMKNIHGEMYGISFLLIILTFSRNIDKVDNTMDDIREQMDLANEISAAISSPLGNDYGVDMDELDAELEQIEQAELDATLLDAQAGPKVTTPAMATPAAKEPIAAKAPAMTSEEAELEELRASMAM